MIARQIIHGNIVLLPQSLVNLLPERSRKKVGQESTALVYEFVVRCYAAHRQLAKSKKRKPTFCLIRTGRFQAIGTSKESIHLAKRFLEGKGFLKINHSYSTGSRSKGYRPLKHYRLVPYATKLNVNKIVEEFTQQENNAIATRCNLNQLRFDEATFYRILNQRISCRLRGQQGNEGTETDRLRAFYEIQPTLYPVVSIANGKGRVFRDRTGRLQSPFTFLHKSYRCCFSVDGFPLIGIDMVAAQPTLLGLVSDDEQLIDDCAQGKFYEQIAKLCDTDRETAKENYCWFAYGAIKTKETPQNADVYKIQRWF